MSCMNEARRCADAGVTEFDDSLCIDCKHRSEKDGIYVCGNKYSAIYGDNVSLNYQTITECTEYSALV